MTYYIDPGTTKGCAVALFEHRHLRALGIWDQAEGFGEYWGMQALTYGAVYEHPQMYPSRGRETEQARVAKANDLIAIAAAGSACAHVLSWGRGGVRSVLPREWKRQLPKPVHHLHTLRLLTETERALVDLAYVETTNKSTQRPIVTSRERLDEYVRAGCLWVAKNPGKGLAKYLAKITDLLDAVALGLTEEGRLVL